MTRFEMIASLNSLVVVLELMDKDWEYGKFVNHGAHAKELRDIVKALKSGAALNNIVTGNNNVVAGRDILPKGRA